MPQMRRYSTPTFPFLLPLTVAAVGLNLPACEQWEAWDTMALAGQGVGQNSSTQAPAPSDSSERDKLPIDRCAAEKAAWLSPVNVPKPVDAGTVFSFRSWPDPIDSAPPQEELAYFSGIGHFNGGTYSSAQDVDATGLRIVGRASDAEGRSHAVIWEPATGLRELEGGVFANAISDSGCVIVGSSLPQTGDTDESYRTAFRWIEGEPLALAPSAPSGDSQDETGNLSGVGISGDGTRITVRLRQGTPSEPRNSYSRWTPKTAPFVPFTRPLPTAHYPAGLSFNGRGSVGSRPVRSSSQGPVVTKAAYQGLLLAQPQREQVTGVPRCTLRGSCETRALDLSRNGKVIVGSAGGRLNPRRAVRWDLPEAHGYPHTAIPTVISELDSTAELVSGDGRLIVGYETVEQTKSIVIWANEIPYRLVDLLQQAGLDLSGWSVHTVTALSSDGHVFVGRGTNPEGNTEGWVARLPDL